MDRLTKGIRRQAGQQIILFALMLAAMIGIVALAVDVGYAYAERRFLQNGADAATMAAAILLAEEAKVSVDCPSPPWPIGTTSCIAFSATQGMVYKRAKDYIIAAENRGPVPPGVTYPPFTVEYHRYLSDTWVVGGGETSAELVPPDTDKVRVRQSADWDSWFARVVGVTRMNAAATATARIAGVILNEPPPGPTWPMVRRRSKIDLKQAPHDPASVTVDDAYIFWSKQVCQKKNDDCGSEFKAVIDLSDTSAFGGQTRDQPITEPMSGIYSPDMSCNQVPNCTGGSWDSSGSNDKQLDLPNWAYRGFLGRLSLSTEWGSGTCPSTSVPSPCDLPDDAAFHSPAYNLPTPDPQWQADYGLSQFPAKGDWVEIFVGDLGDNTASALKAFVDEHGDLDGAYSSKWGKRVRMTIFLWEGGQVYNKGRWEPWDGKGSPDRVHLVDFWAFDFYYGLIDQSEIRGFWSAIRLTGGEGNNNPPSGRANVVYLTGE